LPPPPKLFPTIFGIGLRNFPLPLSGPEGLVRSQLFFPPVCSFLFSPPPFEPFFFSSSFSFFSFCDGLLPDDLYQFLRWPRVRGKLCGFPPTIVRSVPLTFFIGAAHHHFSTSGRALFAPSVRGLVQIFPLLPGFFIACLPSLSCHITSAHFPLFSLWNSPDLDRGLPKRLLYGL